MTAMPPTHAREPERTLAKWQLALVILSVTTVCLVLVAYGAAGSYDSLWHLADSHGVPLPRLAPIGLDGGLIGVIILSIGLTWAGHPLAPLRMAGRMFALGTLAANAAAGWPDPVAVFLRVFAPALVVIITEAVYAVLLGRNGEVRDRIPVMRWVLSPWPTFRLWRRMVLWRVNDYGTAVDMELSRLRAIKALTTHYRGKDWRTAAPADLVWMLTGGVRMPEALAAVAELTAPAKPEVPATAPTGTRKRKPARKPRERKQVPAAGTSAPELAPEPAEVPAAPEPIGVDEEAAILRYLGEGYNPTQALVLYHIDQGHSASEAGVLAGKSDGYGRQVARLARDAKQEPAAASRTSGDMS